MRFEYVAADGLDPHRNLALEHALVNEMADAGARDTCAVLLLWQNARSVVLGRNQDAYAECRVDALISEGGTLARRRSGGGAVYHDEGNLNYSVLAGDGAAIDVRELLVGALAGLGISARVQGANDVLVGERKVCGTAAWSSKGVVCQHGCVLVDSTLSDMTRYLTPERSKLARHAVKSVDARVANLSEFVNGLRVCDVQAALLESMSATLRSNMPSEDKVERLCEIYSSVGWIYGREWE